MKRLNRIAGVIALTFLAGCGASERLLNQALLPETANPGAARYAVLKNAGAEPLLVGIQKFGTGATVLQEAERAGVITWISSDGSSLRTQNGLLVGTRGLGGDVLAAEVAPSAALVRARGAGQVERFMTFLNGENRAVTRSYVCDISSRGPSEVEFSSGTRSVTLMQEDCVNPDRAFVNLYWVAPSGRILQSNQYAGEFLGPILLRIVPEAERG